MNVNELSYDQLLKLDDSLEEFIFKQSDKDGEPFAPIFRKDPQTFKKIIRELVSFKRDLIKLFSKMYDERYMWLNTSHFSPRMHFAEYDKYFYDPYYDPYNEALAQIIEEHNKKSYDTGILAFIILFGAAVALTSDDAQKNLTAQAFKAAGDINTVTKKRIAKQIEASLQLNEDRAAFEKRLQKVLINPYRGRLIAEDQALKAFLSGSKNAAAEAKMLYKTWEGIQTDKKETCGSVIGETVGINENFSNGLPGPLAHLRCRCGLRYSRTRD